MRWHRALAVAGAVAGAIAGVGPLAATGVASAQVAATSATPATASPWGKPIEIPGLGALNTGHDAAANSISCATPGNCAATGNYNARGANEQGFVVNETKGHWGKAIEIPGLGALIKSGTLFESSVACGSPGDCAVGGDYIGGRDHTFAFVASEVNGKWSKAIAVPGLAALNTGKDEGLTSVSCSPGGNNCTAGGEVLVSPHGLEAFVVNEKNGKWGKAIEVPGLAALNKAHNVGITRVTCASAGNCVAFGNYQAIPGEDGKFTAFVASETKDVWGRATQLPGLKTLAFGSSSVHMISCPSLGHCSAAGFYEDKNGFGQAFAVDQK